MQNSLYQPDLKLAKNFTLKEACQWAEHLPGMSKADRKKATTLAIKHLTVEVIICATIQAGRLQSLRDRLNLMYHDYNIWILVTCWFRPDEWEAYRGRDLSSYHPKGLATDFVIMGLPSREMQQEAMEFAYDYLTKPQPLYGVGWSKHYKDMNFIHDDARGIL